jgi:hypothetical protein
MDRSIASGCPTVLANTIRVLSWVPITLRDAYRRRDQPSSSIDYRDKLRPIHITSDGLREGKSPANREHILFGCSTELNLLTKGPYPHYIGSVTGEKKSGAIYQILYAGRRLQAAQRLLQLNG